MPSLFTIPGIINGRFLGLVLDILIAISVIYYIRSKKQIFVRRVPGLDAIEEAVGRSAEMGKPIVCSFGIASSGFDYWTLAGLAIMAHVARLSAKMGVRLIVPTGGSDQSLIVRPVAEEIVKDAYTLEGVGDHFNPDDVPFLSGQQYAYVGGYVGILQRLRPGSVVMTGSHASDAMNIAETSNAIGAITITSGSYLSNTAALACASDYILIGEEAPAASAYLSTDPAQRASIRVQDIFKWLSIGVIILGLIAVAMGSSLVTNLLAT
jgi:hypothetical protein